ncbi:MAG: sensor histidine kinase [Bacteroidota bacterium]
MEGKVILLVVIGTIGVMLMAFSVVFFVLLYKRRVLQNELEVKAIESRHQQEMLSATLKSQEAERNRLGTELHDSVGAMLSSIKLNLQVSKKNSKSKDLNPILGYLDETIVQVRSISHQMMPIVLKKYGLKKAIEDYFEKVTNDELKAEMVHWEEAPFDADESLMLFRIVQELTNNSIKHANASLLELEFKNEGDGLHIKYLDNGVGFPKEVLEASEGMGLLNIKNRSQSLGAKVSFDNKKEGGACVELVLDRSNV